MASSKIDFNQSRPIPIIIDYLRKILLRHVSVHKINILELNEFGHAFQKKISLYGISHFTHTLDQHHRMISFAYYFDYIH
jgi:hypothetical protein